MRLLGILFSPVGAWWRWAGQRQTTQGKVLAYGGPVAALLVIIIIASATGGGDDEGDTGQATPTAETATAESTGTTPTEAPDAIDTPLPAVTATPKPVAPTEPPPAEPPPTEAPPTEPPPTEPPSAGCDPS